MIDPLIVDAYEGDGITPGMWAKLALAGRPWCGAILKATQGISYKSPTFPENWRALQRTSGPRYGIDWFRGAYHYLDVFEPPANQALAYLDWIRKAGGWGDGDLWPIVDVERSGNAGASKAQVIDRTSTWALVVLAETGRKPMLYGGSFLRDLGIHDRMGCQLLWVPRYASTLPASTYTSLGFDLSTTWGWQYLGVPAPTSPPVPPGYPSTTPIGQLDTTAIIINGGGDPDACVTWTRQHLGSNP